MSRLINLQGQKFTRLTVVSYLGRRDNKHTLWQCVCDCGQNKVATSSSLVRQHVKSCGCLQKEVAHIATHRMTKSKTYSTWRMMIQRCENKKSANYHRYGGRGISVCPAWHDFTNFLADMGVRPEGTTLDRKNCELGYSPDNCRWATHKEQADNKEGTIRLTVEGVTMTISEWAEKCGIRRKIIYRRFLAGWPHERIVNEHVRGRFLALPSHSDDEIYKRSRSKSGIRYGSERLYT